MCEAPRGKGGARGWGGRGRGDAGGQGMGFSSTHVSLACGGTVQQNLLRGGDMFCVHSPMWSPPVAPEHLKCGQGDPGTEFFTLFHFSILIGTCGSFMGWHSSVGHGGGRGGRTSQMAGVCAQPRAIRWVPPEEGRRGIPGKGVETSTGRSGKSRVRRASQRLLEWPV